MWLCLRVPSYQSVCLPSFFLSSPLTSCTSLLPSLQLTPKQFLNLFCCLLACTVANTDAIVLILVLFEAFVILTLTEPVVLLFLRLLCLASFPIYLCWRR